MAFSSIFHVIYLVFIVFDSLSFCIDLSPPQLNPLFFFLFLPSHHKYPDISLSRAPPTCHYPFLLLNYFSGSSFRGFCIRDCYYRISDL